MAGTTYHDLNNLISNIRESGYLEGRCANNQGLPEEEDPVDEQNGQPESDEDDVTENVTETNGHITEADNQMLGQTSSTVADQVPATQPSQTEAVPAPTQVKQEPTPSFNFLQESQIDLESPHMDPAVVMVHPAKRPVQPPGNYRSISSKLEWLYPISLYAE